MNVDDEAKKVIWSLRFRAWRRWGLKSTKVQI
jgi:hypothetical protein